MRVYRQRLAWAGCLAAIALLPAAAAGQTAQIPTAAVARAAAPEVLAPAAPRRGFIGYVGAPISKCKSCWRRSSLRKLLKNAVLPLKLVTGGLIGGGHDQPLPPPLVAIAAPPPPPPAVSAAAQIKMEAAQAQVRVDAVRYLATVDCHWYPEAEEGLIASLRCDRSECVRLAAAEALGRGCCCTKKTIAALQISAAGSNRDGNPGERCSRVRWAALAALQTCLAQCNEAHFQQQPYLERPETPADPLAVGGSAPPLGEFYSRVEALPADRLLYEAQRTVAALGRQPAGEAALPASQDRSLYGIWAGSGRTEPPTASDPAPVAASVTDYYATTPAAPAAAGYPLALPLGAAAGGTGYVQPASAALDTAGRPVRR